MSVNTPLMCFLVLFCSDFLLHMFLFIEKGVVFLLGVFVHSSRGYPVKHTSSGQHLWAVTTHSTSSVSVSEHTHTHVTFEAGLVRSTGFSKNIWTLWCDFRLHCQRSKCTLILLSFFALWNITDFIPFALFEIFLSFLTPSFTNRKTARECVCVF